MTNLVPLSYINAKIRSIPQLRNIVDEIGYANYPKKYYVVFDDGKKVRFGNRNYEDTLFRTYRGDDPDFIKRRRALYKIRHKSGESANPKSADFLSYWILW
jgi:hypothetical protein